ncbi:THUMP domain-containing protein [Desulfurococcaceae archaeon MEX13E-LK6-19]|nr:THUMP domain-containing protein [Desulfurococcaceae archaeon MEX13E-LK6-19]
MSSTFNLIVTHEPGPDNYRYVVSILREIIPDLVLVDTGPAVLLFKVKDPYSVVEELSKNKDKLNMVYRVIPVDRVTEAYVETVAEEASKLAEEKIPKDKTYRISLRGRLYWKETKMPAHSLDAIKVIAEKIDRTVSLTHPDYVVYIRSLRLYRSRRVAAITVTTPDKILSLASGKP